MGVCWFPPLAQLQLCCPAKVLHHVRRPSDAIGAGDGGHPFSSEEGISEALMQLDASKTTLSHIARLSQKVQKVGGDLLPDCVSESVK